MEQWKIKDDILEYDDASHSYYVNGNKVESITQILHRVFPNKYSGISPEILNKAAKRGSLIHANIQVYEELDIDDEECQELQNWKIIKNVYNLECLENEVPIILRLDGRTYAGRLDLVLKSQDKIALADIKTTSVLDKEYLALQLNLYRLGYQQSYDTPIELLFGVHLRKDIKKLVSLPINEERTIEIIKRSIYE